MKYKIGRIIIAFFAQMIVMWGIMVAFTEHIYEPHIMVFVKSHNNDLVSIMALIILLGVFIITYLLGILKLLKYTSSDSEAEPPSPKRRRKCKYSYRCNTENDEQGDG